jgi:hypothetical protein
MIVAIAAGSGPAFTMNPLRAAETMTGYIARISGGDVDTILRITTAFLPSFVVIYYYIRVEYYQP